MPPADGSIRMDKEMDTLIKLGVLKWVLASEVPDNAKRIKTVSKWELLVHALMMVVYSELPGMFKV